MSALSGCITIDQKSDPKLGVTVTTVAVTGCGNPSQRITYVERRGHKEDSLGSAGPDPCNAVIGAGGGIIANTVLPHSGGITVQSGSWSQSGTSTSVNVGGH